MVLASLVLIIPSTKNFHIEIYMCIVFISKSYMKFSSVNQINFMKHNCRPISIGKEFYFQIGILVLKFFVLHIKKYLYLH
jgi:hypothetical protein